MSAVIYHTETKHIYKRYDTERGAKAALTRARKGAGLRYMCSFGYGRLKGEKLDKLAVATMAEFNELDGWTTVKNMMSGKEVKIRESEVGGCTDPSTERYWSM